jgi:class 3 adenylate cyclase/DNA-binding response OmpR family regulator
MDDEKKRILIMEDSDIFYDMLQGFLSSFDYNIERAVNGFEGIKKVYSFLPHIVITDVEMPLFKGYQVTRLLKSRKNTKNIPVIMLTSLDQTKDKFWGKLSGADKYLEKIPENYPVLGETISSLLSNSENIDFTAIGRESKKINDNSIIEIVNNLLDNKLFQTTVIGMLTELSGKVHSMETVINGIFELLRSVCEYEIASVLIRGSNKILYTYTANIAGFSKKNYESFKSVSVSDFKNLSPDFNFSINNQKDFFLTGTNEKKILSYITIPLKIAGKIFATLHIANSINDYFTPVIMENINVFTGAASPVIANSLSMHELSELQKNTRTAFARYVPASVMDEIINESVTKTRITEKRNISVLFSDMRNFTNISEQSDVQSIVDFLNTFFSSMGTQIISEGGHIDKFIGDAIMAFFGAFGNAENSPKNAVCAAIRMIYALDGINSTAAKTMNKKIEIGIGINYGGCILGNIGFQNKMDYTIIGDTVNLASRLESLSKLYNHPVIISEYVYEEVKDNFITRKIDNVRVKGKEKPVGIFAVYSGFSAGSGDQSLSGKLINVPVSPSLLVNSETLNNYNKGLQLFYMREWKLAEDYFKKSLEIDKNDFLSQIYLERSGEFARNPPPDNWDGVVTLTEK